MDPGNTPLDSTFRLLLVQLDVFGFEALLRDWMAGQPGVAEELDTLLCDGKTLRGSIAENDTGAARFVAPVSLYSQTLGVAIAQTTVATDAIGEIQALRQLLEAMYPVGDAGAGAGGGALDGQCDDHRGAQPWGLRGLDTRRDPLLHFRFEEWTTGPAQGHQAALVHRKQLALGQGCAAARGRPPLPAVQRRPDPGHAAEPGDQWLEA